MDGVSAGAAQLVGRERELATLRGLIASAAGGNGCVVMVFGEPGIGKTRLVGEAAALARAEGATVCFGTCYEREGRPPYAPWDEVLTQYTRALEPGSFPQGVRESAAIVAPVVPEFDWAVEAEPERLRLVISVHTVERHLATIYRKIGVRNRTEATAFAYKSGLANT